ncbi:hypothetical protein PG997_009920 [Apiospora hydei]|uniref:Uncharacterized protein n=1 Tax=Apiospora hydei TaxID=1337664 RepID=A0ABR1VVL0_9PEZI
MVRSFLATVNNIHAWSHACLDHLIQRSLQLRPSTLVSLGPGGSPREQFQGAEGHEGHRPQNTGPPSWVEEQRMVKAFWRLQFFLELRGAGARGLLDEAWPRQDLDILLTSIFGSFYEVFEFERQQLLTAYDFFVLATGRATTITASEVSLRDAADGLPIISKKEATTSSRPVLSCAEQPSFGFREDIFDQGPEHLDRTPMSYHFQDFMSSRDLQASPLLGVPFEPYRKFGFAIWDNRRMADLGFRAPKPGSMVKNRTFYYFRWRSILTEEELAQRQPSLDGP